MENISLFKKLQQLSIEDLRSKLESARRDLFGLRFNAATSSTKDSSQYKKLRTHVARIMTAIRAKEMSVSASKEI